MYPLLLLQGLETKIFLKGTSGKVTFRNVVWSAMVFSVQLCSVKYLDMNYERDCISSLGDFREDTPQWG